jgi:thymidylate synthase (FAD)
MTTDDKTTDDTTRADLIGKVFPVLDQGWVKLADVMGSDRTIVDRARGTIGDSARKVSSDRDLIRLMMRKHHGSSFEFPEIDVQLCSPFITWRQQIRHRAGNILDEMSMFDEPSVNELSGRYSVLPELVQVTPPDGWRRQSTTNRQGSGAAFPAEEGEAFSIWEHYTTSTALSAYRQLIAAGVAKEQARKVFPMGGYTIGFMKMDLRNWLHWLTLRLAEDAQSEIREYANVIADKIVKPLFPITYGAFEDYVLHALTLSALDIRVANLLPVVKSFDRTCQAVGLTNRREVAECRGKLARLGLIEDKPEPEPLP